MDASNLFHHTTILDEWNSARERQDLDLDLLKQLRTAPPPGRSDIEVAIPLAGLVHEELIGCGTDGNYSLSKQEITAALLALQHVTRRLGIDFAPSFRDFDSFRSHWMRLGLSGSGGWQARRHLLEELFNPVHARLTALEQQTLEALAVGVSPHSELGWSGVDEEIRELRRRFATANTAQDYRSIGGHCVGVLEALGQVLYDPARHLRDGESVPPRDKTKARIGRYIEDAAHGPDYADLRGLLNKVVEFAHHVKHTSTGTRYGAGIAADSVIMLSGTLRRLDQDL